MWALVVSALRWPIAVAARTGVVALRLDGLTFIARLIAARRPAFAGLRTLVVVTLRWSVAGTVLRRELTFLRGTSVVILAGLNQAALRRTLFVAWRALSVAAALGILAWTIAADRTSRTAFDLR